MFPPWKEAWIKTIMKYVKGTYFLMKQFSHFIANFQIVWLDRWSTRHICTYLHFTKNNISPFHISIVNLANCFSLSLSHSLCSKDNGFYVMCSNSIWQMVFWRQRQINWEGNSSSSIIFYHFFSLKIFCF